MSWMEQLYETYEKHLSDIGDVNVRRNGQEYTLLPVAHTTQNAHIELAVTPEGDFHSAVVIDSEQANTTIPTTEASASRSGKLVAPYPIHDKLSYCAGDYTLYGEASKAEQFEKYYEQLQEWSSWDQKNEKLQAVTAYISKRQLIQDLFKEKILHQDEEGKLLEKWKGEAKEKPDIFKVSPGGQSAAFVRFDVHYPENKKQLWKDKEMFDSFADYYETKLMAEDICFVTGETLPKTERHANKIRNAADKAKLISTNDTSGFTFRGRFSEAGEAAGISFDASQKMHNALKWLIRRQGKTYDGRSFIVWVPGRQEPPNPLSSARDLFPEEADAPGTPFTKEDYAEKFVKAMNGWKNDLDAAERVNILVLDAATPGRLAVLYYQVMEVGALVDRIAEWHGACAWMHSYKNEQEQRQYYWGAPSHYDIAKAVYGRHADDKVIKEMINRLLPCVTEKAPVPKDIVSNLFHRASSPVSMEKWEWEKVLSTACAFINIKEGQDVSVDTENTSRDYLFGRLLAVADVLEKRALSRDENRATNAVRYMNSFSKHPERTWKTIQESIQPYQAKLGRKAGDLQRLMDEIGSKMTPEDFTNKPLSGKYLLGFYSQRHELYNKNTNDQTEEKGEDA
ncbi:type I-C CRISPR-associated protein Cas8c/Csd1 [Alkalicoccus urumqiensis]|uniref:Type I-C CRISPR-associated protein Cas8c/Csd1 n=1 Tax=Alkalicoccus urumqiensis TaxID=1548213 RepID=A0A2P6MLG4_ALKUR|nr:type I-C CRISPR-associated protein Cas8c/Csd1 [Alkalicoccus urumqiensis]PRO67122.1 type I-C CRISPR-associated protein Cas8c/Csd1 [Alkalicoccus urumqiensis]